MTWNTTSIHLNILCFCLIFPIHSMIYVYIHMDGELYPMKERIKYNSR